MSRADRSAARRRLAGLLRATPGSPGGREPSHARWLGSQPAVPVGVLRPDDVAAPVDSRPARRAALGALPSLSDDIRVVPAVRRPVAVVSAQDDSAVARAPGPPGRPVRDGTGETGEGPPASDAAAQPGTAATRGGWVPDAMRVAAHEYRDVYGTATDLSGDDEPRVRVRWAVPWRLAASAATVLALVVGATLIRAVALAPGDPVALPLPAVSAGAPGSGVLAGAATTGDAGAGAEPVPTPSGPSATVVVHVVGAVHAPGVVHLPAGARVADAVAGAGGADPDADLARLNLARVLVDGEQVVVPRPGDAVVPAPAAVPGASGTPLDLNTAGLADLDALPGIGPVLAQRILDRRQKQLFTSVDELGEVSGIGPTLLDRLRPLVHV